MTFWWLAIKDLLIIVRDKKAFLTLILMPLLLIAILGAAFGDIMKQDEDVTINKFTLGVANLDKGQLSKALTEQVFSEALSSQIRLKTYHEDSLRKQIKEHKLSVGLVIPPDFTSSLMSGDETRVKLLTVPDPGIKATIVKTVMKQFSNSISIEVLASNLAQPVNAENQTSILEPKPPSVQITQPLLNETTINAKTKPVGSFQYYAAAMSVMFLLMTVVQGVAAMILEKEQDVYKRLLLTNLTYTNYLSGKMLGLLIISLAQAFIIIVGTQLLFGVDWSPSISGLIMMTFAFVFNACGLGLLAGSFIKTEKAFSVAGMFGTQIMAALGGSMAPLYFFPDWVISVTKLLPNGLALHSETILKDSLALLGFSCLFFLIGLRGIRFE